MFLDRPEQLDEPGEGEIRLRLDAGDPQDAHSDAGAVLSGPVEQRRFADAGLAAQDEAAAAAGTCGVHEVLDRGLLARPAVQQPTKPFVRDT
ncbi:hypothetical protein GCM10020001_114050 [Nonomuraea salmonea]